MLCELRFVVHLTDWPDFPFNMGSGDRALPIQPLERKAAEDVARSAAMAEGTP
jgi:hypothetical protein